MESAVSFVSFVLRHYGLLALFTLFAYRIGRRLTLGVSYHSGAERFSFCTGLGLGVIATLVFVIGILRLLTLPALLILFVAIGVFVLPHREEIANFRVWLRGVPPGRWLWCVVLLVCLVPVFLLPLFPPTQPDAVGYHLTLARMYATAHAIEPAWYLRYPVFPHLNEMLFTVMVLVQDDIAAQLVQFLMMWVTAIALYAWGSRAFNTRAGWFAAALWLSNPLVLWLGSSLYVDVGLAMFLALAVYGFLNWRQSRSSAWLILSAALFGFAAQSKYLALFPILGFGLYLTYVSLRQRRAREWLIFAALVVVSGSPWYLYNAYHTGNPIWPYWGSRLGYGPWIDEDAQLQSRDQLDIGPGKGAVDLLLLPWKLAYEAHAFAAEFVVSPAYLFVLPLCFAIAIRDSQLRVLLIVSGLYTLFWFGTVQSLRYLVPAIPVLSLAAGAAVERLVFRFRWVRSPALAPVLTGVVCIALALPGGLRAAKVPGYAGAPLLPRSLPPVLAGERDRFLRERLQPYAAIDLLNRTHGANYTLYNFFSTNLSGHIDGRYMGDFFGPARYSHLIRHFDEPQAFNQHLRSLGVDYFLAQLGHSDELADYLSDNILDLALRRRSLKVVYAEWPVVVFAVGNGPASPEGPNLLRNSGFEDLAGGVPVHWSVHGQPVLDSTGSNSFEGVTAVQPAPDDWLQQRIPVQSGRLYVARHSSRSVKPGQFSRLQVHWFDSKENQVWANWEPVLTDETWKGHSMILTAPSTAVWADVYASVHGDSEAWVDDFSFSELP